MSEKVFDDIATSAGIPADAAAIKSQFQQVAADNNVGFNNNSDYSPFWRLILALITTPTLWLVGLIKTSILPNMFVKTASGTWLELLAWAVDITRNAEVKAAGNVTFTRLINSGGLDVPIGTVIQSAQINGTIYEIVTTEAVSFVDGNYTALVPVEAVEAGSAWNLGAGFYAILKTPIAGIRSVSNGTDWLTRPGADAESDDDLRLRVRNQFSAVNQYHTDAVYKSIISQHIGIETNQIYFEHGAPRGAGSANAFILFDADVPTQSFIDSVNDHIRDEGNHGHGDDLLCFAMPETQHNLVVDVWSSSNLSAQSIINLRSQIQFFIQTAFREATLTDYQPTQTLPWSRFSFSRLGQELHREFPDIQSIDFNTNDIVSEMTIPRLTSLLVNMQ